MTTYTLLCSNSTEPGNPVTAESIYAGLDIPVAVTEVTHTTGDGIKAGSHGKPPKQESTAAGSPYEPARPTASPTTPAGW